MEQVQSEVRILKAEKEDLKRLIAANQVKPNRNDEDKAELASLRDQLSENGKQITYQTAILLEKEKHQASIPFDERHPGECSTPIPVLPRASDYLSMPLRRFIAGLRQRPGWNCCWFHRHVHYRLYCHHQVETNHQSGLV